MTSAAQRRSLEEAIVDTVREALVVLDDVLRVVVASRSFYRAFKVTPLETEGRPLYELGDGQWDIPALRERLAAVIPRHTTVEEFEVEDNFPKIGRRTMLLMPERSSTRAATARACWWRSKMSPSAAPWNARRMSFYGERRVAAAEGSVAQGDESPGQQQPANHRQHPAAEGANSPIRGNPPAPSRRALTRHGSRDDSGTTSPTFGTQIEAREII